MQKIEIKKKNLQNSIIPYLFKIPIFNFMNLKYIKIFICLDSNYVHVIYILIKLPDIKTVKYLYYCRFDQSNKVFPKQVETHKMGVL